ncbi:cob(I)yrinic acid a,c-diamide adenosyltransferase [Rubricoccus marinus]|uniref:Corrinoid adenosyltransferase n=1 Tax=Rubricoccus marinus TaxID=716817 RepID=A0A259TZA4_9BACT|nr:cob(I)yrinic acid a,c-diamide adenosyltransferase [Rubricoccus marinus]OZC02908.1 ATP:cob(I)alamin adenosyltransferase [Rubricoccus marinus]
MKVYTKTGDDGTTALFGGDRVSKSHPRIAAYGTVDEVNSVLGMARATLDPGAATDLIARVQNELFVLGGDLAAPEETTYPLPRIEAHHTEQMEADIDRLTADLAPLKNFILPGGTQASASLHLARTVSRRAERLAIDMVGEGEVVSQEALNYLNRLSDWLFTLARWVNHDAGVEDIAWVPVADRTPAAP